MAGIGLYGQHLAENLASSDHIELRHRLESVKLLSTRGATEPDLYGWVTIEAVGRAETAHPHRTRTICVTATAPDSRDQGKPSSWSAAIDRLAAGGPEDPARLIVLAAGNVAPDEQHAYPDCCHSSGIHDPAQSWNAITVGSYTRRQHIDQARYPGWQPIAPDGSLSPCSTTSLAWPGARSWPLKPDIVLEGGNSAVEPSGAKAWAIDELRLLSTSHRPTESLLTATGDTSAAAAQGARMAAILQAEYPRLRPETTRALLVHSADWTPAMLREFPPTNADSRRRLLRCYGFGVPNLERALWCASNHLTLIVEDALSPYHRAPSGGDVKTNEMHLHYLPWPEEVLLQLGEVEVCLRVSLSYFVEPNPARLGKVKHHAYPSCSLRFDLRRPAEDDTRFRQRLNRAAREDDDRPTGYSGTDRGWTIGPQERHRGSIHSDRWRGPAADLARRGVVAVYPTAQGWWRTRKRLQRYDSEIRYSLVVTIETPTEEMDVYTPVAAEVAVPIGLA